MVALLSLPHTLPCRYALLRNGFCRVRCLFRKVLPVLLPTDGLSFSLPYSHTAQVHQRYSRIPCSTFACLRKPSLTRSPVAAAEFPRSHPAATLIAALPLIAIWFQALSPAVSSMIAHLMELIQRKVIVCRLASFRGAKPVRLPLD